VVNASSSEGELVLNGMSYSDRGSPFSNGALVVSCHGSDYKSDSPLAGFAFQKDIERKAFQAGGGNWSVPAQNLMDFLGEQGSSGINENSYKMGAVSADMRDLFPEFVITELLVAFQKWRTEVPLFVSHHAILLGAETRTTSPVRISRNEQFESINIKNLYPIGEGAGYTGGITSSAADAIKAVDAQLL
ncbi:MAG TPA: dehydrogenase, partial [Desulfobacterales bacterium]|nr:dehydrogenase [Desulfobacterales bacterium]